MIDTIPRLRRGEHTVTRRLTLQRAHRRPRACRTLTPNRPRRILSLEVNADPVGTTQSEAGFKAVDDGEPTSAVCRLRRTAPHLPPADYCPLGQYPTSALSETTSWAAPRDRGGDVASISTRPAASHRPVSRMEEFGHENQKYVAWSAWAARRRNGGNHTGICAATATAAEHSHHHG